MLILGGIHSNLAKNSKDCLVEAQIINSLKHRFDGLPIHKLIYYHSYDPETLDRLNAATYMRSGQRTRALRSKSDPTGNQQDCLGMTPLHILACSTVQNMDLYRMIVENYPENIITEDKWGTLPLFYALWGNAPSEVVQFLVERCQSIYPNHELNWSKMVETLGRANEPRKLSKECLICRNLPSLATALNGRVLLTNWQ